MAKRTGGLGKGLDAIFIENESENRNSTVTLKISEIEPNRTQPRTDFDEQALAELADSISRHGVLQPILVRPIFGGGYQIVAGERRYRASLLAGITEMPVIIRELTDSQTMELALIENLQREDLSAIEEARGYRSLADTYDMTQEQIADAVGKSRPAVTNALRLLRLPQAVQELVSQGKISAGHARALVAIDDEQRVTEIARQICEGGLTVRAVEQLAQPVTKRKKSAGTKAGGKPHYFTEVEMALTQELGKRVSVIPSKGGKGGLLQIEFYSDEELEELANRLGDAE